MEYLILNGNNKTAGNRIIEKACGATISNRLTTE